ncbi:hypothetical protein ACVOMV_23590 [Mesorhizobium atlanticum]
MTGEIGVSWLPAIETGPRPVYLKIVDALADARSNGRLQPGDRLAARSGTRAAAGGRSYDCDAGVFRSPTQEPYRCDGGPGTFVTPGEPEEPVLDLSMNIPPAPSGLNLPALIRTGIEGLLKRSSAEALLSYHPGPGSPAERAAGSSWLTVAGDRLPVDRVVVGSGAQALLAAVVLSETHEGDTIRLPIR